MAEESTRAYLRSADIHLRPEYYGHIVNESELGWASPWLTRAHAERPTGTLCSPSTVKDYFRVPNPADPHKTSSQRTFCFLAVLTFRLFRTNAPFDLPSYQACGLDKSYQACGLDNTKSQPRLIVHLSTVTTALWCQLSESLQIGLG